MLDGGPNSGRSFRYPAAANKLQMRSGSRLTFRFAQSGPSHRSQFWPLVLEQRNRCVVRTAALAWRASPAVTADKDRGSLARPLV